MASSSSHWVELNEQLSYDPKKIIGMGGFGTVVFTGSFKNEPVAVKQILKIGIEKVDSSIQKEVELLKEASGHANILGYIDSLINSNFLYKATVLITFI